MSKPSNFSQFKWKVAYLDVGQFLELGLGMAEWGWNFKATLFQ